MVLGRRHHDRRVRRVRRCHRRRRFLHLDTLEREVLGQQRDAVCAAALRYTRYVNIGVRIFWSVCE